MKKKLKRKTFDKAIDDAFLDYVNGGETYLCEYSAFHAEETPNRNPEQIPQGIWSRLIYKHINKIFYN